MARVSIEHGDQIDAGLVGFVGRLVGPLGAHGEAGLPDSFERHARDVLFGRLDRAARDDDIGLQLPGEFFQPIGGTVEEEDVDGAVLGEQFADLRGIVGHQAGIVRRLNVGDVALDVLAVGCSHQKSSGEKYMPGAMP